jgi:hypothetical protein
LPSSPKVNLLALGDLELGDAIGNGIKMGICPKFLKTLEMHWKGLHTDARR